MTSLPLQLFGKVTFNKSRVWEAMLCRNQSDKNEVIIHLWTNSPTKYRKFAVLFEYSENNELFKFIPKDLYRVNEYGAIWRPGIISHAEQNLKNNLSVDGVLQNGELTGTWSFSPNSGKFKLAIKSRLAMLEPIKMNNWDEFKKWVTDNKRILDLGAFRGQGCNTFSLQTSFHRTQKCRLEKYVNTIFLTFQSHAEAITDRRINLSDGFEYSTLLGLAQHHGLPTPMLDWSYSPYIAAFFAFSDALENSQVRLNTTHVRIYAITNKYINIHSPQNINLSFVAPYTCFLSISGRNNPRLYVQQGTFLVTNILELETFIHDYEIEKNETALYAVDLPINSLREAMSDLQYMGITAGSLFPGLDGIGKMLRQEMLLGIF